jgi:uncharacterized cupredoxin-like copper-binding protein
MRSSVLCVLLAAATTSLTACDAALSASAQGAAQPSGQATPAEGGSPAVMAAHTQVVTDVQLKPEVLDLESVNYLVKKGKVKDAAQLEKQINNPKEKMHKIDLDGDGKLDKIQIVEVKKPNDEIVFELHVIPSKKGKEAEVVVAYIDFVPDKASGQMVVKATYAPVVVGYDTIVYDYTVPIVVQNNVIVVQDGPAFFGWLYMVRPAYVGVVIIDAPVIYKHKGKHKWKGQGQGQVALALIAPNL